jgi:hypothetical protein
MSGRPELRQILDQISEIFCIGCGCSDYAPCEGGCSWAATDPETGVGICSNCAAKPLEELLSEMPTLQ